MDKKRFLTSAPHGRGATPYTEMVEYRDMIYCEIESLNVSEEVAITKPQEEYSNRALFVDRMSADGSLERILGCDRPVSSLLG